MKLAVTSDLHVPVTPVEKIAALAREIAAAEPDAVAVAGDVGESLPHFRRCLELLRDFLVCPLLVLPGNHDLWSRDAPSRQKWEVELPRIVRECGCVWFEGEAFVAGGVAIAGSIAWYDYSAVDPGIVADPEIFARKKRLYNVDAIYIDWSWTDLEFAERVAAQLLTTLDRLEDDPAIRRTIVLTHVPLVECQMCRDSGNPDWAFSNAYFGNLTLGEKVLARKKVAHIISGHTHVERRGVVQTADGREVHAQVIGSDYGEPAWVWVEC